MQETRSEQKTEKTKGPHSLRLDEHRLLTVTGVKAVPTFTDKLIEIELEGESLTVTGKGLTSTRADSERRATSRPCATPPRPRPLP